MQLFDSCFLSDVGRDVDKRFKCVEKHADTGFGAPPPKDDFVQVTCGRENMLFRTFPRFLQCPCAGSGRVRCFKRVVRAVLKGFGAREAGEYRLTDYITVGEVSRVVHRW